MSEPAPRHGLDLPTLYGLFPTADDLPGYELVPGDAVPPPYHGLLVHDYHMTVTMEAFYGDLVDVRVLDKRRTPDDYARKILLSLQRTGKVVQFGIVRILLQYCSPAVREEILAEQTPLGRILIKHAVLRRIEPTAYLRIVPSPAMMAWFGLAEPTPTYGRLAYIHCDHQPAVELLEIAAPVM
ncbi:MAG: hypothetical protein JNM56_30485 [Planctomycetia bacterium]|nr:hypothetical protein [Planctomycetia bacterium]